MAVNPYRVLVADDHRVVRHGLRVLLESQPGIQVCGKARAGVEAMAYVKKEKPDLLVLGLTIPEVNGPEVMPLVRKQPPATDVCDCSQREEAMNTGGLIVRSCVARARSGRASERSSRTA